MGGPAGVLALPPKVVCLVGVQRCGMGIGCDGM